MKFSAIIVAYGSSQRMGNDKLLLPLAGKPILQYALNAFLASKSLNQICLMTSVERFQNLQITKKQRSKITRLNGGQSRQDSVWIGLQTLVSHSDFIAVHDAARPLISPEMIEYGFKQAQLHQAVSLAHPISDTLKRVDTQNNVEESVSRENVWAMETPQIFETKLLFKAYRYVMAKGISITDEVSAVQQLNHPVKLIANPYPNPKITFPTDLATTEKLIGSLS